MVSFPVFLLKALEQPARPPGQAGQNGQVRNFVSFLNTGSKCWMEGWCIGYRLVLDSLRVEFVGFLLPSIGFFLDTVYYRL